MRQAIGLVALLLWSGQSAVPQEKADPYIWLEEVDGAAAVEWARVRTERTLQHLTRLPVYDSIRTDLLRQRGSATPIPDLAIRGTYIDHIWRTPDHQRGLWRRTTTSSYLAGNPQWETLLDIDALAQAENVNWTVRGTFCLFPELRHCMIRLSRGGSDAHVLREFDAQKREFVTGGFSIAEERMHHMRWIDANTVLVGTVLPTERATRTLRRWRRGTPLEEASVVFQSSLARASVVSLDAGGVVLIVEGLPTRERTFHLLRGDRVVRLELPNLRDLPRTLGPSIRVLDGQLVFQPAAAWNAGNRVYPAGAVLAVDLDAFVAGNRNVTVVVAPDERTVIYEVRSIRDAVIVELLRNVRSELHEYRFVGGRWNGARVPAPELGVAELLSVDATSGLFLFRYENFLQPPMLYARLENGEVRRMFSVPEVCDTSDLMVEQLEAKSRDGTRVPYFVTRSRTLKFDGSNPTLLYGYGGYGIAQLPRYQPPMLCTWGKRGGVHVVSNIRGGGEFGPAWHQAGRLQNRQNAFDDFFAVAEDLIRRRFTSPQRLGIRGISNGGTLMGVAVNQRPELFAAVIAALPVFDLKRHNRMGGNPIDSDLGDPDNPEHWAVMSKYSPYHNVSSAKKYPPVLIISNRRDDRAPVGNARKMAARLEEMGHEVLYYEEAGGGHGTETLDQPAMQIALAVTFLLHRLQPAERVP